tara:strand:- start:1013 stop:1189 length:177 start_codon:yes stop_codon:yes gene_type:complete
MDLNDYLAVGVGILTAASAVYTTRFYCDRILRHCGRAQEDSEHLERLIRPLEKKVTEC